MSDRELIEMAAKAAGIGPLDFDYAGREGHGFYCGPRLPMPQGAVMAAMWTYWRPLEDDGDALRLATKLSIDIEWQEYGGVEAYQRTMEGAHFCAYEQSELGEDPCAAIRRSIVRAAAEIGKNMK